MRLEEVDPYDEGQLATLTRLVEAVRAHDDPGCFGQTVDDVRNQARFGGDLNPPRFTLLVDGAGEAVGFVVMHLPVHDNHHLMETGVAVVPALRGRGHGSMLLDEVVRQTVVLGRTTIWHGIAADDTASARFLGGRGFTLGTRDARRHQVLASVDAAEVDRFERDAVEHARDYVLERLDPPYADALLADLVAVSAAMNDAPMGTLDFEDEVFDLDRLRDSERARALRGERMRRVVARHGETGEVAGYSTLVVRPWAPREAYQHDTAVSRTHRGHRLGMALKLEMMRWLAETEPQLEVVETWNNVENLPMIRVNEALGYRLTRTFAMYQRVLPPPA